jgi:hypothetical protein
LVWIGQFLFLSISRKRQSWWKQLLADTRLPEKARGNKEQSLQRYGLYFTHQVAAYTLGGLALTAWSILLAMHSSTSSDRFALAMLGLTVVLVFGSSVLFRAAGGEMTRMGYESGLAIGSLSLVFAMAALLLQTFSASWLKWPVWIVAGILVLRDLVETFRQMQITAGIFPSAAKQVQPPQVEPPRNQDSTVGLPRRDRGALMCAGCRVNRPSTGNYCVLCAGQIVTSARRAVLRRRYTLMPNKR